MMGQSSEQILEQTPEQTLGEYWCEFRTGGWPEDLLHFNRNKTLAGQRMARVWWMNEIVKTIGRGACYKVYRSAEWRAQQRRTFIMEWEGAQRKGRGSDED